MVEPQKNQCRYSDLFNANFRPCYMNFILSNLSQIILGRKINFSPLYIVFSKLTLNESQTFFENHLTFTLRQQIKALHNFKNSQSLLSGVTHLSLNRKLVGSENRFSWVRSKVDGPNGWNWSILKLNCGVEMYYPSKNGRFWVKLVGHQK